MLSVLTAAAAVATPCGMLCTDTALRASAVVAHERNSSSCEAWTVVLCGVSPSVKGAPTRANLTKRGKPSMLHTIRMYMLRASLSVSFSSATRKKQPPFTLWVRAQSTNAQFSNQLTYRYLYYTQTLLSTPFPTASRFVGVVSYAPPPKCCARYSKVQQARLAQEIHCSCRRRCPRSICRGPSLRAQESSSRENVRAHQGGTCIPLSSSSSSR